MNNELLKIPVSINKVETMSDRTLKMLVYTTAELIPEDEAKIMRFRQSEGIMVFSPADIKEEDLIDLPKFEREFKNEKSPSEKLRNVLWVFYTQNHEWKEDADHRSKFEAWRKTQMEKFIDTIKAKLK